VKSALTICLVPEARRGPFVVHDGLAAGCRMAVEHGFDGVEIFPADAGEVAASLVRPLLETHGLSLAAVGTGAGWVKHGLSLCHVDADMRLRARAFIASIVDAAGGLGAPAIIGSMQGRTGGAVSHEAGCSMLADALGELGALAASHGQPLLYEPLNRYETDLFNRQLDAAAFIEANGLDTVKLLCDLFHMNIERPRSFLCQRLPRPRPARSRASVGTSRPDPAETLRCSTAPCSTPISSACWPVRVITRRC